MGLAWLLGLALAWEPVAEDLRGGVVNWTSGELLVSAAGTPHSGNMLTLETLEDDARSTIGPTMLALARRVRVDGVTTVGDLIAREDPLADALDETLSLWDVQESRYFTSGKVEVDGALLLQDLARPLFRERAKGTERPGGATVGAVSGVVVDARGLGAAPALLPRLRTAGGEVLYSVETLTQNAATTRGPVAYVADAADPVAARRAGAQPMWLRATAVADGCDLVLSDADAQALKDAAAASPFLLNGGVVLVVGP